MKRTLFLICFYTIFCLLNSLNADSHKLPEDTVLFLVSAQSGLVLDVSQGSTKDGTDIIQYTYHGQINQQLKLIASGDGESYFIESQKSKKYLDITADGSLIIKQKNGTDSQKWKFSIQPDGSYLILAASSGKAITVKGASKEKSAAVHVAAVKHTPEQGWRIRMIYPGEEADLKALEENNAQCDFEKTLAVYGRILDKEPAIEHEKIITPVAYAAYYLLLKALGKVDMSSAKQYLTFLDDLFGRNARVKDNYAQKYHVEFLKEVVEKRSRLGLIKPQYIQKVLVLFVKKAQASLSYTDGKPCEINAEMTREEQLTSTIAIEVLKAFVETFSDGQLSLDFDEVELDTMFTNFNVAGNDVGSITPEYNSLVPYPSKTLYRHAIKGQADTIIWVYPNNLWTNAWGGSSSFPLFPYHMQLNRRGFVELHTLYVNPSSLGGLRIVTHEFMHSIQSAIRSPLINVHYAKEDAAKWKKMWEPFGYTERDELSTYWFQFQTFVPKQIQENNAQGEKWGWKIFSWSERYPQKLSEETMQYNLDALAKVPVKKRQQAWKLKAKADEAWEKGDKKQYETLYKEAFALDPIFFNFYRYMGDQAVQAKDYEQAVEYYQNYIRYTDDTSYYLKIGTLLLEQLKKPAEANTYYLKGLALCGIESTRADFCLKAIEGLRKATSWGEVLKISKQAISYGDTASDRYLFYQGEATFLLGKETEGEKLMSKAIANGTIELNPDKSWMRDRYRELTRKKGQETNLNQNEQSWQPQPKKALIMLVVAHPDDEGYALGGIIPYYAGGLKLPVIWVAMTSGDGWCGEGAATGESCRERREQESLCAAWNYGLRNPPIFARFPDCCNRNKTIGEENLEETWKRWGGKDKVLEYLVKQIRTYQPEILVSHATNGEYGHGNHLACSAATREAFELAGDPTKFPEQLKQVKVWQPKKCYLHNYPEGKFTHYFDYELPGLNGRTVKEAGDQGIHCHKSQGGDKNGSVGSGEFGLYKSTVGPDRLMLDFLENIDMRNYTVYTISGEISLPEDQKAPSGGMETTLTYIDSAKKRFYRQVIIPENRTSAFFYLPELDPDREYLLGYCIGVPGYVPCAYYSPTGTVLAQEQASPVFFTGAAWQPLQFKLLPAREQNTIPAEEWRGEYFNNTDLAGQPGVVVNSGKDFLTLNTGSFQNCINPARFSARFSRKLNISETGTFIFSVTVDDGARLYLDNTLLIDQWQKQAATLYTADVLLTKGDHFIKVEYFQSGGSASLKLKWQKKE